MYSEWMAFEHYRIHVMELWSDGPRKEAGLAAARSALDSLTRNLPTGSSFACTICVSRQQTVTLMPDGPPVHRLPSTLAA
jgi:hypothetical protein